MLRCVAGQADPTVSNYRSVFILRVKRLKVLLKPVETSETIHQMTQHNIR